MSWFFLASVGKWSNWLILAICTIRLRLNEVACCTIHHLEKFNGWRSIKTIWKVQNRFISVFSFSVGNFGDLNSIMSHWSLNFKKLISLELRVYLEPGILSNVIFFRRGIRQNKHSDCSLRSDSSVFHSMRLSLCRDRGGFISSERRAVDPNQSKSRNPQSSWKNQRQNHLSCSAAS